MKSNRRFNLSIIFIIWVFATLMNLDKPYNIDDTAYLETAQWILQNPWHPMQGKINWEDNEGPIHLLNQPHLYFYILAAWGHYFGFGEIAMHVLQSFFTFACILLTFLIANTIIPNHSLLLTALVTLSPAFVVGQNLMVDIPLLSFWLAFYYLLIKPNVKSESRRFILAGIVAGLACLIKYSSLTLLAVMLLQLIFEKKFNLIWTISIPIAILLMWSGFNYLDYGSIHILNRESNPFSLEQLLEMGVSFLICLGSILPYSLLYFSEIGHEKHSANQIIRIALISILIILFVIIIGAYLERVDEGTTLKYLRFLFLGNGTAVILLSLREGVGNFGKLLRQPKQTFRVLYLWLISETLFVILFAPSMATRHVLLVILPCSLLMARLVGDRFSTFWSAGVLLLTVSLTFALGISDRIWAGYYKEKAALIRSEISDKTDLYFCGHWGWQWYAKRNGMKQLEGLDPQINIGDYLAYPEGIAKQTVKYIPYFLNVVKEYNDPFNPWIFFKTDKGRFYSSDWNQLPWVVNRHPFDPIKVCSADISPQERK